MKTQNNFERQLPTGYRLAAQIDAKSTKVGLVMTLVATIIMLAVAALLMLPILSDLDRYGEALVGDGRLFLLTFFLDYLVYLVLHELTHGVVYKHLTKEKLTFGFSWSCAFCGVPHIYTYRKTALYAVLAPFVVFTIVFVPLLFLSFANPALYLAVVLLFASHMGGCVGDLYVALLFFARFCDPRTLMNDTGPCMTFFVPDAPTTTQN